MGRWGRRGWLNAAGCGLVLAAVATAVGALAERPAQPETAAPVQAGAAAVTAADDEMTASMAARAQGSAVEVTDLTNQTDQVFANPDGTFTLEQAVSPVRAPDPDGEGWVPIDTDLQRRRDGSIGPKAAVTAMAFSAGGEGPLVRLGAAGRAVSLSAPFDLPEPTLDGPTATYAEVLRGVDLTITASATGFSHTLVVKDRAAAADPALARVSMPLATEGLEVRTNADGLVEAIDPAGAVAFATTAASMWDSPPQRPVGRAAAGTAAEPDAARREAPVAVEATPDALTLVPDPALLADPAAQFPIVIDPSWTEPWRTGWAVARRSHPNTAYWVRYSSDTDGLHGQLKVGHVYSGGVHYVDRTFLNFDSAGLGGARIISAELRLYEKWAGTCTPSAMEVWLTTGAGPNNTWNAQPGFAAHQVTQSFAYGWSADRNPANSPCPRNWAPGLNVTGAVQQAADNWWGGFTLGLKATDESNGSNTWKRFGDDVNDGGINTIARVLINYNRAPNAPYELRTDQDHRIAQCRWCDPGWQFASGDSLTLFAKVTDPDPSDAPRMAFDYWGGRAGACYTAPQAQGTDHSCTLDLRQWGTGWHIGWLARGFNDVDWSHGRDGPNTHAGRIIVVDRDGPVAAPTVASAEYPDDGEWHGGPVIPGTFTFGANGVDDVDHYRYGWDDQTMERADADALGGNASVTLTPPTDGPVTLYVRSVDRAGNRGPIALHRIYVHAPEGGGAADYASGAGLYVPVLPKRIVDPRWLAPGEAVTFSPLGHSGIPSEAAKVQALVYNLTALGANGSNGIIGAEPTGTDAAIAADFFGGNRYTPTLVTTPLGPTGEITLTNHGGDSAMVFVDIEGFYTAAGSGLPGATYVPVDAARIVQGQWIDRGQTWSFSPLGKGGVPADRDDVAAVAFTVTVYSEGGSWLAVHPGGTPYPGVSNLNATPSNASLYWQSNHVIGGLGADGTVSITLADTVGMSVYIDVYGYYANPGADRQGGVYRPVRPQGTTPGMTLGGGAATTVNFAGRFGIPTSDVSAVALAAHTHPGAASTGGLDIWPGNAYMVPDTGFYPTDAFRTVQLNAQVDPQLRTTVYNQGAHGVGLYLDVMGYFLDPFTADERVAEWRFEIDDDHPDHGDDASGHGHAVTPHDGASFGEPGQAGDALQLDNDAGGTQHATTDGPVVRTGDSYSMAAWLRPDEGDGYYTAIAQDGNHQGAFYLQVVNGHWRFAAPGEDRAYNERYASVVSREPAALEEWSHVAAVRDVITNEIRLYVNGELQGSAPFSDRWQSNGAFALGRARWNGEEGTFWRGAIDEVRVWPRAVTATEIRRAAGIDSPLFARWRLDGDGSDETGGRPATPVGTVTWTQGLDGNAVELDGTGELATAGPGITTNQSYSVSAWVQPSAASTGFGAAVSQDGSINSGFKLGYDVRTQEWKFGMAVRDEESSDIRWVEVVADYDPDTGEPVDPSQMWTHLVGVYDAEARMMRLYVNGGVEAAITNVTNSWNAVGGVQIGRAKRNGQPVERWRGLIDDARLHSGALTAEAVGTLYDELRPA